LLIAKVRPTDRGVYTCVRANDAGEARGESVSAEAINRSIDEFRSGSAHVSVLVRTQIVQPPADAKVILGHVAGMTCKVSADSGVPYSVKWFHDDRLIKHRDSHRIDVNEEDGTLRIAEARASDAGEYTCEVESQGGNDR